MLIVREGKDGIGHEWFMFSESANGNEQAGSSIMQLPQIPMAMG